MRGNRERGIERELRRGDEEGEMRRIDDDGK